MQHFMAQQIKFNFNHKFIFIFISRSTSSCYLSPQCLQ